MIYENNFCSKNFRKHKAHLEALVSENMSTRSEKDKSWPFNVSNRNTEK